MRAHTRSVSNSVDWQASSMTATTGFLAFFNLMSAVLDVFLARSSWRSICILRSIRWSQREYAQARVSVGCSTGDFVDSGSEPGYSIVEIGLSAVLFNRRMRNSVFVEAVILCSNEVPNIYPRRQCLPPRHRPRWFLNLDVSLHLHIPRTPLPASRFNPSVASGLVLRSTGNACRKVSTISISVSRSSKYCTISVASSPRTEDEETPPYTQYGPHSRIWLPAQDEKPQDRKPNNVYETPRTNPA